MIAGVESSYVLPRDIGPVDNRPSNGVSFGEAFRATFAYNYRPLLDAVAEEVEFARTYDPMFDPFTEQRVAGYEDQLNELALAKDEEHFRAITANIDRRRAEKQTLAEAGMWSGGMWVAALIDPMNIAFAISRMGAAWIDGQGWHDRPGKPLLLLLEAALLLAQYQKASALLLIARIQLQKLE